MWLALGDRIIFLSDHCSRDKSDIHLVERKEKGRSRENESWGLGRRVNKQFGLS